MKKRDLKREIRKVDDGIDVEKCLQEIEGKIELVDYRNQGYRFEWKKLVPASIITCVLTLAMSIPLTVFFSNMKNNGNRSDVEMALDKEFKYWTIVDEIYFDNVLLSVVYAQRDKLSYAVFITDEKPLESIIVGNAHDSLFVTEYASPYYLKINNNESNSFDINYLEDSYKIFFETDNYIKYIYRIYPNDIDNLIRPEF